MLGGKASAARFSKIKSQFGPCFLSNLSVIARVTQNKKADVAEHPEAFHHVGLLFNGSSAVADYPLFSLPITWQRLSIPENSPTGCGRAGGMSHPLGQRARVVSALSTSEWVTAMVSSRDEPIRPITSFSKGTDCSAQEPTFDDVQCLC